MKLHRCVTSTTLHSIWRASASSNTRTLVSLSLGRGDHQEAAVEVRALVRRAARARSRPSSAQRRTWSVAVERHDLAPRRRRSARPAIFPSPTLPAPTTSARAAGDVEDRGVVGAALPAPAALAPAREHARATPSCRPVARCRHQPSRPWRPLLGELGQRLQLPLDPLEPRRHDRDVDEDQRRRTRRRRPPRTFRPRRAAAQASSVDYSRLRPGTVASGGARRRRPAVLVLEQRGAGA